ncbi:ubinuclein-2-like isoform X2 [Corticium candelabrum]|nr:ubinuclein-2-like isoform X2 [Corticium candelabrum]XP_062514573.1 ubinuclein-2-like isoform X2 [Corticium candelabrum]
MAGKRAVHEEDYVDVACGYDETDPFVDNSEAHDDFLPHDFEPQYGGFYVNSGELLFKEASECTETDSLHSDGDFKTSKTNNSKLFKLKPPKTRKTKDGKFEPRKRKVQKDDKSGNIKQSIAKHSKANEKSKEKKSQETLANVAVSPVTETSSHTSHVTDLGESESKVKPVPQLPADLPADLKNMILLWKAAVENENATTKPAKTLQTVHNQKLLDVGRRIMVLKPKKYHIIVYEYLASFLPATKETLQRRLKAMLKNEHDELMKEPLDKLRKAVNDEMSEQINQYTVKRTSMSSDGVLIIDDDNSEEESGSDKVKSVGPLKKFIWTETVRGLACDVVRAKVRALREINRKLIDPQSQMKTFLRDEVKTLWPQGWMNSRVLYLETKSAHESLTQIRPKKTQLQSGLVKKNVGSESALSLSSISNVLPSSQAVKPTLSVGAIPLQQSVSLSEMPATVPQILPVISPVTQFSSGLQASTAAAATHSAVLTQHSYSQPASAARPALSLQIRNTRPVHSLQTIATPAQLSQLLSMVNQGHLRGQVQIIQAPAVTHLTSPTSGLRLPNTKNDKT